MRKLLLSLMVILCLSVMVAAEEGMWMLDQVKDLELEKKGFEITAADIYSPGQTSITQTIVLLGGGTSELISPNGLILTNHHVAFGAVQRASTKGTDFITRGFLAKTLEEEIEAPGYTARIIQERKDITAKLVKYNKIKDPLKRKKTIDAKIKKMTDKIEKGKTDIDASVYRMYNGKKYVLFVYKRFDDVRVAYVPPMSIGNYGGDIDNWMWPRHTGDFSFMRIYMAPDGTGRKYHKDNVPYKPKKWLKVAKEGLKKGDMTFIMGFPGRTVRYRTSSSVDESLNHMYPFRIQLFKDVIELGQKFAKDSPVAKAKIAGLDKSLNNGMKNYQGNVDGMKKSNFLQKKIDFENELMAFLEKDEKLFAKYGDVLPQIKAQYETLAKKRERDALGMVFGRLGGTLFGVAGGVYNVAREREKPKKERNPNFSEKDVQRQVSRIHFPYLSYYEPFDKALLLKALKMVDKLPSELRYKSVDEFLKKKGWTIEQFVEEGYKVTKLKDVEYVKTLFTKSSKDLEALGDPFIDLMAAAYDELDKDRKENEKWGAKTNELRKKYIDALYAWKGSKLYPDANRNIRFSLGEVAGYQPRDAVYYEPFTYIKGMLEKDSGKAPFNMMDDVKKLYAKKDFGRWSMNGDVPIAFTHKVDSTGGNSGSPVMNAKGELVGILFDGNYEAMTGDWQYDAEIQRSISVDIRFVMWVTEKVAKADNILKEMGL